MLTKQERSAIVERLRYVDYIYDGTLYRALFGCDAPNDSSFEEDSKAMLERLADLIDPTCHVTDEEVTHEPTLNALAVHVYRCDSCSWYSYMAEVCCHPKPFYCPMCGARVVRDDD